MISRVLLRNSIIISHADNPYLDLWALKRKFTLRNPKFYEMVRLGRILL
jgi:hypothetical protein